MKRLIKLLGATGLMACGIIAVTNFNNVSASTSKGTLYGNEAGTKYCCKSGTNDCAAKACKSSVEIIEIE